VTGCYAERAPAEIAAMPGVVSVLPQSAKDGLADRVTELDGLQALSGQAGPAGRKAVAEINGLDDGEPSFRARAYLKIQDGCDGRCAYCIIPSVRGPSRSIPAGDVVVSVKDLARRGFREIVLAGIHLSSYGEDLEVRGSLLALLVELRDAAVPAHFRLSSLDPRKTDAALMAHIAGEGTICPHIHLSLQHASGRILRLMGRAVDPGSYENILDEMRRLSPEAAIGADMMVGFPEETEADFEELRSFVNRSELTYVHVFSYSPRPGTATATRPRVHAGLVTERSKALRRLAALKDFRFRRRFIGRELEAVVIARKDMGAEVLTGNSIRVFVPSCRAPERELVRVSIRRVLPRRTEGEIVA
jgi:threonylcarbamoyladenosine tRNA methylthiotransferase MtaB